MPHKHKIKKLSIEKIYKTLLMVSGSVTIIIGMVNQVIKMFQGYTKKAVEFGVRTSEAVSDVMVRAMSPTRHHPIMDFLSNHWQIMLIGLGALIVLFVIIFVVEKEKGEHHG